MKEYPLRIDPRILELLGPNLYTNIYYVLAELIANAYDADAKNVYILSNPDDIRVEDDGQGMSYERGEIAGYLNVAHESRTNEGDALTTSGTRRKMGRKGVGKLAALSVSAEVDILTVSNGEKSGFVLARRPEADNKLRPIPDDDVRFERITDHGTAIVMRSPQYRLHKTLGAVKRNLLKIFPLANQDFRIHVIRGSDSEIIDNIDKHFMPQLGTLITLGPDFASLAADVPVAYPERHGELVKTKDAFTSPLVLKNTEGVEREYALEVKGWIGTYTTTRDRKAEMTDFPDNFISLFANKKLGEFNILPVVGQNKLNEVYVVGQLHADLFELSELPDMALSNRQGYKSDDRRYEVVLEFVRKELLAEILRMREIYTDLKNKEKKLVQAAKKMEDEERLRQNVDGFRTKSSRKAADEILELAPGLDRASVEGAVSRSINENAPDLGLKAVIDSQKKKILISQTRADKPFADVIYKMLLHNNVPAEDILYTNCDDDVCREPEGMSLYDYLRAFFVDSYSTQKMLVLFVTSENTKVSWGAITEVGASWITQVDHKIFNIHPFRPEHPLDDNTRWQSTNRDAVSGDLWIEPLNANILCQKIEAACDNLGYRKKSRQDNMTYLATLVSIRNS